MPIINYDFSYLYANHFIGKIPSDVSLLVAVSKRVNPFTRWVLAENNPKFFLFGATVV